MVHIILPSRTVHLIISEYNNDIVLVPRVAAKRILFILQYAHYVPCSVLRGRLSVIHIIIYIDNNYYTVYSVDYCLNHGAIR